IVLRDGKRYIEAFDPAPIRASRPALGLPPAPVIMITGGLGHMGLSLAEAVFSKLKARLVLIGRTALPEPSRWAEKANDPNTTPAHRNILQRLAKMRNERDEVLALNADLNDASAVKKAVQSAIQRFGGIDMVVHGAARIDAAAFASAADTGVEV